MIVDCFNKIIIFPLGGKIKIKASVVGVLWSLALAH
jgi:hypothetical protein